MSQTKGHSFLKTLIKGLGLVLLGILAIGFINTKQASAQVTLNPDPGPIPAAYRTYLENADTQTQTPAFALWIASASNEGQTTVYVPSGSTAAVPLQYIFAGAVGFKTSIYDVNTRDQVQSASSSPAGSSVTGIGPTSPPLSLNFSSNTPGTYSQADQGFNLYPPPGGFTAQNGGTYTITLQVKSINEFSDGKYECVGGTQLYVTGFDYQPCQEYTVSESIDIVVQGESPTANLDTASCLPSDGGISGWAFDGNDSSQSLNIDIYVNDPAGTGVPTARYPANVSRPDVDAVYGISGNHGFSIDPATDGFLSKYATPGNSFTVYLYALGINSTGGPDGENPLIGEQTITCPGQGLQTGNTGSASCVTPPGFEPSRLPYDPGEQVAITVGVNYTPPSGTSGGPINTASYISYQEGTPPPTITLTAPNWAPDLGTSDTGPGASLTAKYIVPNEAGPFNVNWTYTWTVQETNHTYQPGGGYTTSTTNVQEQQNCTWPGGTGPPTYCIGGDASQCSQSCPDGSSSCTTICSGGGTACSTTCAEGSPTCLNVAYYPYFRVYGGDISAGGTCSGSPSTSSKGIYGWPTLSSELPQWGGGSATQFGEGALGTIEGAASAGNVAIGPNAIPDTPNGGAPTGLAFSNQATSSGSDFYGGCSGGANTPVTTAADYDQVPANSQTFTNGESLNGLTTGNYFSNGDVNLGSDNPTIANGQRINLYVKGNVEISGDITFANDSAPNWTSTTQIPSLWIIASGTIGVDYDVSQLDGVYVAQGDINSCNSVLVTDPTFYATCDRKLTVNGAFIAGGNVYLDRTAGTVSQSGVNDAGANAAEVFNYNPFIFLPTQTSLGSNDESISGLPPVL